jgi:hypothetical protein
LHRTADEADGGLRLIDDGSFDDGKRLEPVANGGEDTRAGC